MSTKRTLSMSLDTNDNEIDDNEVYYDEDNEEDEGYELDLTPVQDELPVRKKNVTVVSATNQSLLPRSPPLPQFTPSPAAVSPLFLCCPRAEKHPSIIFSKNQRLDRKTFLFIPRYEITIEVRMKK